MTTKVPPQVRAVVLELRIEIDFDRDQTCRWKIGGLTAAMLAQEIETLLKVAGFKANWREMKATALPRGMN